MATLLQLKGSLFDVQAIGTVEVDALPEVGDVVELGGKSYTVTDLIQEEAAAFGSVSGEDAPVPGMIAIVEPLAVSQRRGRALT